jgi:serine/threonine protein kinase
VDVAQVALKVVPARNYRHNDRAKQLLRTEVAVMGRIRQMAHPHLMQFKHTFEDPEKIVMVLEFLSGQSADTLLSSGFLLYCEPSAA